MIGESEGMNGEEVCCSACFISYIFECTSNFIPSVKRLCSYFYSRRYLQTQMNYCSCATITTSISFDI